MAITVEDLNAGWLIAPSTKAKVCCHCLVLRDPSGVALVDTGIGLEDVRDPVGRIGQATIDRAGFQFCAADTARRQLEKQGIDANDIRHILLTHLDPDHAGGLSDFRTATVHLSAEEVTAARSGDPRYRPIQFDYSSRWVTYSSSNDVWFGTEARRVDIGFSEPIFLVPLFGHTAGHCGIAVAQGHRWTLHIGDAYYLRAELADSAHPVNLLAAAAAVDDTKRLKSLDWLRRLSREHESEVRLLGYHDVRELPRSLGGSAAG